MIIVALVADTHIGSTVGLATGPVRLDDGGLYQPTPAQGWLRDRWGQFWQEVDDERRARDARVVSCLVGDVVDVNTHTAFQLISENPADVLAAAEQALAEPLLVSDALHILRGTEAHSGGSSHMEELLARRVGLAGSRYHLRMELEGVRFDVCHHPQTSSGIAAYQQSAMSRQAWRTWVDYHRLGEPPPHVVARAHAHYYAPPGGFEETLAFSLPPWQLSTSYGFRRGAGAWIEPVGGLLVYCDAGRMTWRDVRYRPERGEAWTLTS